MAMGKLAVVPRTGPSRFLPDSAAWKAPCALSEVEDNHEHHGRQGALWYFDAEKITRRVLERALP